MHKTSFYIINSITVYRLFASLVLLYLIIAGRQEIFKWMLAFSFFTDGIDGYLARRYKTTSMVGARLDSIADDLTILMAILGVIYFKPGFFDQEKIYVILLVLFYVIQNGLALYRYRRLTSFHTYIAKAAAVMQALFFVAIFFSPEWPVTIFRIAAILTLVDLVEEIILVLILPQWQADVKGLYWVLKGRKGVVRQ